MAARLSRQYPLVDAWSCPLSCGLQQLDSRQLGPAPTGVFAGSPLVDLTVITTKSAPSFRSFLPRRASSSTTPTHTPILDGGFSGDKAC